MEITLHLRSLDALSASNVNKPGSRAAQAALDEVAFENSRALTTALHNTPESREDVVRRATDLVGDINYPPQDTIRRISHLLAIQINSEGDHS